ncbi:MAG: hypothetical protein P1P89_14085 [Desulfobacterales bacterium]|nr:hypothetical protein [Desulfobacterales bacterium]
MNAKMPAAPGRQCGRPGPRLGRFWVAAGLLGFLLIATNMVARGADSRLFTDAEARFSLAVPETAFRLAAEQPSPVSMTPAQLRLAREALEKYDAPLVLSQDQPDRTNDSHLVILGIKTHRHVTQRFGFYEDYLSADEFFDVATILKFTDAIRMRHIQQGAEDAVIENLVLGKKNARISFTCRYGFPGEDEVREYHGVYLGRTHLVYLDLLVAAGADQTLYESRFHDIAASLVFEPGFAARESLISAFMSKVAAYEVFDVRLSRIARATLHIVFIIVLLNIALDRLAGFRQRRNKQMNLLEKNKGIVRFVTVPVGLLAYLLII